MTEQKMTLQDCDGCPGLCCKGLESKVTRPRTAQEIADVRWQLHFEHIQFFIRNRYWYQLLVTPCMYLDENNFCVVYDERPPVCREHLPPSCERYGSIYDTLIATPEALDTFIANEKKAKKRKKKS